MRNTPRTLFILFSLLVLLFPTASASAMSAAQKKIFANNNIIFYDPDCVDSDSLSTGTCVVPTGDQITWIGDSYSVQASDLIKEKFPGVDLGDAEIGTRESYIQSSRSVSISNSTLESGLNILKGIVNAGRLRKYLVFMLGTNVGITEAEIAEVESLIGSDTNLVLMTPYIARGDDYTSSINAVKSAKDKYQNVSIADWASVAKDEWFAGDSSGVHPVSGDGYNVWTDTIKSALPKNCSSVGLLPGDTNEEVVWNYFRNANIPGVSDNAAAISGIIGNMRLESGLDPFCWGSGCTGGGSNYYGIHQELSTDFKNAVDDAGLGRYWGTGSSAPADAINQAIQIELDWITRNNERWLGTGWAVDFGFITHLDEVDDKNSPESYSDLFMVAVEGCYPGGDYTIKDSKVQKLANIHWSINNWQAGAKRREFARDTYDRLSTMSSSTSSVPSNSNSGFSTDSTYSVSGSRKYTLTSSQLQDLAELARYIKNLNKEDRPEAFQSANADEEILSLFADLFEKSNPNVGDSDASDALYNFIKTSDFYKDCPDLLNGVRDHPEVTEEVAKSVLNDGLRATSSNRLQTSDPNADVEVCAGSEKKKSAVGASRIAQRAVEMSWPVMSGQGDDAHAGMCQTSSTSWINWYFSSWDNTACMDFARPVYHEKRLEYGIGDHTDQDCGWFVATVLTDLGLDKDDTATTPFPYNFLMDGFFDSSSNWQEVENTGSEDILQPGDVLTNSGHIFIYVGSYGGEYGTLAHAARDTRVGTITPNYYSGLSNGSGTFRIHRYVGDKLGSSDVDETSGLTYDQAKQLMMNYGENKNNSSKSVTDAVSSAQWYIDCAGNNASRGLGGSNCTTFSVFFTEKFSTNAHSSAVDGGKFVSAMVARSSKTLNKDNIPSVWSVFSVNNHTGVILGKENGEWIVGQAGCSYTGSGKGDGTTGGHGAGIVIKSANLDEALWGHNSANATYAHLDVDYSVLSEYLSGN